MSLMKILQTFFLSAATTVFLASCNGPTPPVVIEPPVVVEQTTFNLGITVMGATGAPVRVLNAAGEIKFNDTITGSKTLSALPKGKYTVTGGAVANFTAPAAQTADLSAGNDSVTLTYTAAAGQALALDKIQGTLSDPLAPGNTLNVFFGNSVLASSKVGADGSVSLSLTAPPPASLNPFLPPAGSSCSYTGALNAGKVFVTDNVILNGSQGDAIGVVTERPVGGSSAASVLHAYADIAQNNQGTIACPGSSPVKVDVRLLPGWNVLIVDKDAGGTVTVVTASPDIRVQLELNKFPANVRIVLDAPSLTLKAGESVTVMATIFQRGGLSGKIDLSTDVPGVSVEPASVTLPVLGIQSVRGQSLFDSLALTSHGFSPLKVGTQRLDTLLTFKAAADAKGFTGTMTLLAKQNSQVVGQVGLELRLTAPGVSASFVNAYSGVSVARNETASVRIQVESVNGFSGPVTLGLSGLPVGVTAASRTVQVAPGVSTSADLEVTASDTAALGTVNVQIKADKVIASSSTIQTALTVLTARTKLNGNTSGIYSAKRGVWVVGPSTFGGSSQGLPIYFYPVTRYLDGVEQVTLKIEGNVQFSSGPTGNLLAFISNYDLISNMSRYVFRTIYDDGTSQDVVVAQAFSPSPSGFIADNQDRMWFIDVNSSNYVGKLSRINRDGSINVIDSSRLYASFANLKMSNDGKVLIVRNKNISGSTFVISINTTTDIISEIQSGVVDSISFAVENNSGLWGTLGSNLQKYNIDGTTSTFTNIRAINIIGFDRFDPNILWFTHFGFISKFEVSTSKVMDTVVTDSSGDNSYSVLPDGGLGYKYSVYDNKTLTYNYYLSQLK